MQLRPYQIEPVNKGIEFFSRPNSPSIIVAPTAAGKSIIIAKIVEGINDKVLVLQPSLELLNQNVSKFRAIGGLCTIFSASANEKQISKVTYATLGSVYKRGAYFKQFGFTKLIIDECHLYKRGEEGTLAKFLKDCNISNVLGLTATPLKLQNNTDVMGNKFSKLVMLTNRSKHGNFYKNILHVGQIEEMTSLGYWSKLEYENHDVDNTGLRFNSTKADFTQESLDAAYTQNNTNGKILKRISELNRRSILVSVPSVAEALYLASVCPNSIAVYGDMDKYHRKTAIEGFKNGSIKVVFQVNILSTGFDMPELDTIIMARPTASLSFYYQLLGRGTRIHPDKKECLIIDFSGNLSKFGPIEKLVYKQDGTRWELCGEGDILLTGIPMHKIGNAKISEEPNTMPFGKFKGMPIEKLPVEYRSWLLENISFNSGNQWLKTELERLKTASAVQDALKLNT